MEKIERRIYGFCFLLGGVFLLIFAGVPLIGLIEFLSNIIFYFLFTFLIIVMLYGVILILIGILIMSVNIRIKKSVSLIIFLIGIVIIILSITVIIIDSFTIVFSIVIIFEIFSGIGLIYLGIRLFFPTEGKKKKKILEIVIFIIGLIISVSFGFVLIMMVPYKLESILYAFPFLLLPFLIGIILLIYSIFSIKKRKYKTVLLILRGIFILLILLYILVLFIFPRGSLAFY